MLYNLLSVSAVALSPRLLKAFRSDDHLLANSLDPYDIVNLEFGSERGSTACHVRCRRATGAFYG
jgi:hypothetical protein